MVSRRFSRSSALLTAMVLAVAGLAGCASLRVGAVSTTAPCAVPGLPGKIVHVSLVDMGAMMRGTSMGRYHTSMAGWMPMRMLVSPRTVPAGRVSFVVHNAGSRTHEMVVLPLAPGQPAGHRLVRPDGRVSEAGSRGEASRTCGSGAGEGIRPGSTAWVTLRLPAGADELVCNLPHHYARGMYARLLVH